jgi:hypothetical protein
MSNYSAELGRTGGAVIQMTTKSGTNSFHGSGYEYLRNDVLQAKRYFAKTNSPLRYNLFGASLGGPIKKNRTQFFFNYEGRRQISSVTDLINVPTKAEAGGDFSADSTPVIDPSTGHRFPGNKIPSTSLDPIGAKLAALYPAPNVPGAANDKANFVANDPSDAVFDVYVGRIDHVFNQNNRIFGRLLAQTDNTVTASIFPTPGTDNYGSTVHDY